MYKQAFHWTIFGLKNMLEWPYTFLLVNQLWKKLKSSSQEGFKKEWWFIQEIASKLKKIHFLQFITSYHNSLKYAAYKTCCLYSPTKRSKHMYCICIAHETDNKDWRCVLLLAADPTVLSSFYSDTVLLESLSPPVPFAHTVLLFKSRETLFEL